MSTGKTTQITARDIAILSALERFPLTARQLLVWSQCFDQPFREISLVHRRLRKLTASGLVRHWPYAIANQGGSPHYFRLTLNGYRLLKDDDSASAPRKRAFSPIGTALHHHSMCLADFIVHVVKSSAHSGLVLGDLHGENEFQIDFGNECLRSDGFFSLTGPCGTRQYSVELDNSTETLISSRDVDTIARKIRMYDDHQANIKAIDPDRFVTLFVTTRSRKRAANILDVANSIVRNSQRSLFYAACLPDVLAGDATIAPVFHDQRNELVALYPGKSLPCHDANRSELAIKPALC